MQRQGENSKDSGQELGQREVPRQQKPVQRQAHSWAGDQPELSRPGENAFQGTEG